MSIPEHLLQISADLIALQSEIVRPIGDQERPVDNLIRDAVLLGKLEAAEAILEEIRRSLKWF